MAKKENLALGGQSVYYQYFSAHQMLNLLDHLFCKDCSPSINCTQLEGADQPLWSDKLLAFKRWREENRLSVTDALRNYLLLNKRLWISRGEKDGNLQGDNNTQWGQFLTNPEGALASISFMLKDSKSSNVQNKKGLVLDTRSRAHKFVCHFFFTIFFCFAYFSNSFLLIWLLVVIP